MNATELITKRRSDMKPSKEYINCIGNCKVYGDKILIHISELKRAIKRLKRNPDIYDREHFREGQIDVIMDMISAINRGMKTIRKNNEIERTMTKDEMMDSYYIKNPQNNYEEALKRIKEAMQNGEKYTYLAGKSNPDDFNWVATEETISKLREDGFDIDVVWNPCEYWSIEWGY